MTVTNQGSILTVTDEIITDKAYLHLVLYGDNELYDFSITDSISTFELTIDGWFVVESYQLDEYDEVDEYGGFYSYYDGRLRYLYENTELREVPKACDRYRGLFNPQDSTNVFMLCNIETCLGSLNLDILNDYLNACNNCKTIDSQKADIVYMAYSTIQYMAKRGHFAEAQRLLEKINKCGYLCGQSNCVTTTPCNCN